jgi:amidase
MRLDEYASLDGLELANLVRNKQVTAGEVVDIAISAMRKLDSELHFVVGDPLPQARLSLRELRADQPFTGVPTLIKDIGPRMGGVPQEMGSALAQGLVPTEDSELIRRFRQAGFVFIGRSATPELGGAFTTEPRISAPTRNPWDRARSTGGSSGGAAAAVAAGVVPVALAGDTAGSIRVPAHCCGLFGLKPTRGRNPVGPEAGEVNSGLTVAHVLTRTVRDSAAVLDATAGPDAGCRYYAAPPSKPFIEAVARPRLGLRIALSTENFFGGDVAPEIKTAAQSAAQLCEDLGHHVVQASPLFEAEEIVGLLETIWSSHVYHAVRGLERRTGRTASIQLLEASTLMLCDRGRQISADEFLQSLDRLNQLSRKVGCFFADFDVLLTPTFSQVAPMLGQIKSDVLFPDVTSFVLDNMKMAPFTSQCNLTGQPAMSVPLYQSAQGLPIGVQFAARFAAEETLLSLAGQLEAALPWVARRPAVGSFAADTKRNTREARS